MIHFQSYTWFTVAEVAQKLQLSRKTIYKLIERGELASERKFNREMISESSLVNYLTPKNKSVNHSLEALQSTR